MRLFIINTFQSAADQLCPENDEDRWFFCIWLTRRSRLMYFTIYAAWKRDPYAGEDGLSGFSFWVLLRDKKKKERKREKKNNAHALVLTLDVCSIRFIKPQEGEKKEVKKGNEIYLQYIYLPSAWIWIEDISLNQ